MPSTQRTAPAADMFSSDRQLLQFTGVLVRDAEIRMRPVGADETPRPVLCLDIRTDESGGRIVHTEQAYPTASRFAADAQALRLRSGVRVSITADPSLMRLSLPLVEEVQLHALADAPTR